MAHRMFVAKPWIGVVERDGERVTNIGFQPVTIADELLTSQVIGVDEGRVVAGDAFVVFRDVAVIDFDAMEPIFGLGAGVCPNAGSRFYRFVKIGCAGIGRNDRGVEVIRADFDKPVTRRLYRFLGFSRMAHRHEGLDLQIVPPGDVHTAGIIVSGGLLLDVFEYSGMT